MKENHSKVAVGLSGGVDSSVAAALLKEKGYDVIGITMEIFDGSFAVKPSDKHACYGPNEKEDVEKAASVCKKLKIPFETIDLKKEYRKYVLDYFRNEYLSGKTPNPCIVCNRMMKFGFLLEKAKATGISFEYFATGHYAQVEKAGSRYLLKKAVDATKDQTYFLYALNQRQFSRTLFPLGSLTKRKVRKMASSLALPTADLPESQDFITGSNRTLLFTDKEMTKGDIVDEQGNILGNHRGIIHYTVGQRRGLGIASHQPLYVLKIDVENNRIVVGEEKKLFSKGLTAGNLNFIAIEKLNRPLQIKAKIRLNSKEADATVFPDENTRAKVVFNEPRQAVSPGQSVVFYSGDIVIGGGVIERAF